MDYEQQYYNQKQINLIQADQIKALQNELDYYQKRKWYDFLDWLAKREMIGWIVAIVVFFVWLITVATTRIA